MKSLSIIALAALSYAMSVHGQGALVTPVGVAVSEPDEEETAPALAEVQPQIEFKLAPQQQARLRNDKPNDNRRRRNRPLNWPRPRRRRLPRLRQPAHEESSPRLGFPLRPTINDSRESSAAVAGVPGGP